MSMPPGQARSLLVYEPRVEGHHLGWLRFLAEDLLSAGFELTLAVDLRPEARVLVEERLAGLLNKVQMLPAHDESGRPHAGLKKRPLASCLRQSGARNAFLCSLDEVASSWWRRAAFGWFPPAELRGRVGGIYHRPKFIAGSASLNRRFKQIGFRRMVQHGWLRQLLFLDEELVSLGKRQFLDAPIYFLPTPCPRVQAADPKLARRGLNVPLDKRVFLFYGTGAPRKGLPLAVEAVLGLPPDNPAFLLCAGRQDPTGAAARGLEELRRQGRALVLNRFVTPEEEELCFAACDAVLLPYFGHFGPSDILSRAMSAGKMVIVSDEQLPGRRTRQHGLGLLFTPGNVADLREQMRVAAGLDARKREAFAAAARTYTKVFSREASRRALLAALGDQELAPPDMNLQS